MGCRTVGWLATAVCALVLATSCSSSPTSEKVEKKKGAAAAGPPASPESAVPVGTKPYERTATPCNCAKLTGGTCKCNHCGKEPGAGCYCGTGGCRCGGEIAKCPCGHCRGLAGASVCECAKGGGPRAAPTPAEPAR